MPESTTAKGRAGEDLAALALTRAGYSIIARNTRTEGGEIDVVAYDGEVLCFIEVRRRVRSLAAIESVDARKKARLTRAAEAFLQALEGAPPRCRFDVVIVADGRASVIKNAFEAAS